jgi:hypothetical protein
MMPAVLLVLALMVGAASASVGQARPPLAGGKRSS